MRREFVFSSAIAESISGFLQEKKSMGYKYFNESKWMEKFDQYWSSHGYGDTGLTVENLSEWLEKRDCEGEKCLTTRVSVIRQFSFYLNGLGIPSYIPPLDAHYSKPVIHLIRPDEMAALFLEIDSYVPQKGGAAVKRIANEYPVLFRLIYLNGLRASEACGLPAGNIDWEGGTVSILDGKGNRDRVIYLSGDMLALCRDYYGYLHKELGREPVWFFPGFDPGSPISYGAASAFFRACWSRTHFAPGCGKNPTIHCLRHSFVVDRINKWREQGLDFNIMLPYLSQFLGHKDFGGTFYYYHYVEEAARAIRKKDTVTSRVIPEVMRR